MKDSANGKTDTTTALMQLEVSQTHGLWIPANGITHRTYRVSLVTRWHSIAFHPVGQAIWS
ncbi:hypothetical protein SH528x_000517 [Novipirellula sp. SH528]|uniref:hypothetical protein n=1 Tax=Novipirellula sp. SH528 TaxID=3454466 RepID=UPI003FA06BDC